MGSDFWGTGLFIESARAVVEFTFVAIGAERLEARSCVQNGRGNGALQKLGAMQKACCAIVPSQWRVPRSSALVDRRRRLARVDGHSIADYESLVTNHSEGLRPSDSLTRSLAGGPRAPLRSRGLTRALVRHVDRELRAANSDYLRLSVRPTSRPNFGSSRVPGFESAARRRRRRA